MPAALLYHGFGISNIEYLRTRYTNGEITFDVCHKYKRCKHCKSPGVIQRGFKFRKVRTMPIGFKTVFMNIIVRRFTCKACGYFGYEDVDGSDLKFSDEGVLRWTKLCLEGSPSPVHKPGQMNEFSHIVKLPMPHNIRNSSLFR